MSSDKKHLARHVFTFNEKDNGGEAFSLVTDFWDNGDGVFRGLNTTQQLELNSYHNAAKFHLGGVEITPEKLRKLADELDTVIAQIKTETMMKARKNEYGNDKSNV